MSIQHRFLAFSFSLWLCASILPAQQDMGYITGRIIDTSKAAIPGATVTVVNQQTGDRTVTISTDTGNYTAGPLKIGAYNVAVELTGFKRATAENIEVHAQDRVRVDFPLEVGEISESISVYAQTPLLESENATLGQAVETREINSLPLAGRNFQQLALLSAGVIPAIGHRDRESGFNSHGQRAGQNNFTIDGVDNNSHVMGMQDRKAQVMIPSLDAVREFKVETSNYSAELGRGSGGVMNVTVKSGTNEFHGTAYDYLRNDFFDARDTFNFVDRTGDGKADPEVLRWNQFGFTFGGPIRRNQAFFFGSWEGLRIGRSQSFLATVPTLQERQGVFDSKIYGTVKDPKTGKTFANNTVPQNRWDSAAAKVIGLYPEPNFSDPGTRANYVSGPPWKEERDQIDTRIDHNFSDSDKLFGRFSLMRFNMRREAVFPIPARGAQANDFAEDDNDARTIALGYTKIFSPTLINETRFGYRRLKVDKKPLTQETNLAEKFGIKGVQQFKGITGLPRFIFAGKFGFQGLGEANFANNFKVSEGHQYLNNTTWIRGNHTLKFGGDIRFDRSDIVGSRNAIGQFNFNGKFSGVSLADFLLGMVNQFQQSDLHLGDQRFRSFMFYAQDDWKVKANLTLNLGLRYELNSPWWDKNNRMNKIILDPGPDFGELLFAAQNGTSWSDRALVNTDTNNFAPRLGIAYRIGDNTTVRAGAGIFYGGQEALGASSRMVVNWPFHVFKVVRSTKTKPALFLANGLPPKFLDPGNELPEDISLVHWAADFPQLTTYQWNLSVQRQFAQDLVFKIAYVSSSTNYIPDEYGWNAPGIGDPATEKQRRVFPKIAAIDFRSPYGHGSYHGLDLQLQKRFAHGFSFLTSYTWGKSIDNVDELFGPEGNALQDKANWSADRGVSGYDIPHMFVTSYIFELPFGRGRRWLDHEGWVNGLLGGWTLSGITVLRSGLPFTPNVPNKRDFLGTSEGAWRPDRTGTGKVTDPGPEGWFDVGAFKKPCDAKGCRHGNGGRNILRADGQVNFDVGLMKNFQLTEAVQFQFRWEVFNLFNTPAFGDPVANIESPDAGKVRSTRSSPRIMQFALRLEF